MIKILYLYSEIVGYNISSFKELVESYGSEVHVVHWNHKKLKPFKTPKIKNIIFHNRTNFSTKELMIFAKNINPQLIMMSGWMDLSYLYVGNYFVRNKIPVVCGLDDKWENKFKQKLGALFFPLIKKHLYTHAWVAGPLQLDFAKRIGFKNQEIIFDSLSCDFSQFKRGKSFLKIKQNNYPKVFLYVGNFSHVKGTDILIESFKRYKDLHQGEWELFCVGNGPYHDKLKNIEGIKVHGYMTQDELINLTSEVGAFVLPSRNEQWGVVVHEFTSAGLPLILSKSVGSSPVFFIENYNGISFKNKSIAELTNAMLEMSSKTDLELIEMSNNSVKLSGRITPKTQVANLMSTLKK